MPRRRKLIPIAAAASLSLLLHVLLLTGFDIELAQLQALSDPPPIEARLVRVEPVAPSPAVRRIPPRSAPAVPPPPEVEAQPEPIEAAAPELPDEVPVEPQPSAEAPDLNQQAPVETVTAVPLNRLPDRIEMVYDIRFGPASGQQTLQWVVADGRYTITSVAGATGLTRMLYSGQLIQTSQGRVTAYGLQPEAFWDQRGKKRSSGRFDFENRSLAVSRGSSINTLPLPDDAQDSQSLLFHFALHAPRLDADGYHVFDGRKLRPYYFVLRGQEILDTPLGALKTLHLERAHAPEDRRFEVWLAVDLHYLPVRVLRPEEGGMDGEVVIRSISYPR